MAKKINIFIPMICLFILIMIFFSIVCNLFYRKVIMTNKTEIASNEVLDEKKLVNLKTEYPIFWKSYDKRKVGFGEKISISVERIKTDIAAYTSTVLPYYDGVFECYRNFNRLLGWTYNITSRLDENTVIRLDNGYLSFASEQRDREELDTIATKVEKFVNFLAEDGINFYYINAGYKVNKEEDNIPSYNRQFEKTDFNGSMLIDQLRKHGINILDIREEAKKDRKDWYSLFYKYDHHMKTDTQVWLAGKIAKLLSEQEGYKFSDKLFSMSSYDNKRTNTMFGSQARAILKSGIVTEREEFIKIIPKFDTYFEIELPIEGLFRKGSYENSLFDNEVYKRSLCTDFYSISYSNGYSSAVWKNNGLGIIRNMMPTCNKKKKVLIIQDSFGCFTSTYLAQGIEELYLVHLPKLDGSIRNFIKDIKPDTVLMLYNEGVTRKYEGSNMLDFFDLD